MSGLCFRKDNGLIPYYDTHAKESLYAQIFFLAYNLLRGESIHITETPLRNTVIPKKNWDYSIDNLFGELIKSIYGLGLPEQQEEQLINALFHREFIGRVCYLKNYLHPLKVFQKIDGYDLGEDDKNKAKRIFLKNSVRVPYFMVQSIYHKIRK